VDEDYLEGVLDLVADIPAGRVMTYGTIAEELRGALGRGGPRQVGTVLSRAGAGVPWWRVVNASGLPPAFQRAEALMVLGAEGCPLSADRSRVRLSDALWWPDGTGPE
jgi:methylated-DNA-protein-cysteine methyltransferase related protein